MPPSNPSRAVFLDRDGVLVRALVRGGRPYAPRSLDEFEILPDALEAARALRQAGFRLIVVTNQPDVGNGLVERATVEEMHDGLMRALPLDAIKACFHRQDEGCACRKPAPGMLLDSARELGIDLARSFMVGDRWSDMVVGRSAGCYTVLIDRGYEERLERADATASSLGDAAEIIRKTARLSQAGGAYGKTGIAENQDIR